MSEVEKYFGAGLTRQTQSQQAVTLVWSPTVSTHRGDIGQSGCRRHMKSNGFGLKGWLIGEERRMVLLVRGRFLQTAPSSPEEVHAQFPHLLQGARELAAKPAKR